MAKICKECNIKHDNSADKCARCGAPLEVIHKDVKKKKIILFSILGLVLTIALIVGIIYITSPEARVRGIMEDMKDGDTSGVVDAFPEFFIEANGGKAALVEYYDTWVKNESSYIFSYNIDKTVGPSTKEENAIRKSLVYYTHAGYDESKLQDIKAVWLDMRGGIPGFWGESLEKFVMIKYDGQWYWWPFFDV